MPVPGWGAKAAWVEGQSGPDHTGLVGLADRPVRALPGFYDAVGRGARHARQRSGPLDLGPF